MTDLWTMAGEEAERDEAEHKLALARVACACYWPVLASAGDKDSYEHAKALISEGVTTSVAGIAASPADQAILASRVLDSFDEDWDAHQAALVTEGAFTRQHYEAIAQALKDYQDKNSGGGVIPGLADHWSDKLASTSPLFNKERFLHAATQGGKKSTRMDMPMMTQDHYENIADAIASSPTKHRAALAEHFANVLKNSNVKFKSDLFMRRANPTTQERGRGEGSMPNPGTGRVQERSSVAASRTAVVEDAPGYVNQHPFGLPAEPLENEAPELENEIAAWEGADHEQRVQIGNGLGVSDDSSGPNIMGPGQNQGEDPLLHASALDIEAGLPAGDYRLDAFGALIPVEGSAWSHLRRANPADMSDTDIQNHLLLHHNRKSVSDDPDENFDQHMELHGNPGQYGSSRHYHGGPGDEGPYAAHDDYRFSTRHTAPGGGEHAPYYVRREGDKFKVVNRNGDVKGTFNTKEEARSQQKALYANVEGASEEAEKRHGETPKAVEEEGKKASRHIARELRCTKCGQEVTPKDTKGNYGSCPEGGDHNPEWGPDKEASLQMTALQRQAVQVARNLVDGMPAGVEHHAVAKAMLMRARGFDLTEAETDLVINAALRRVTERLGFTRQADGVSEQKRDKAESAGHTLPGTDKFPINNLTDLENAKHDIGRTNEPKQKVVNYIDRRAEELGGEKVGEDKDTKKESRLRRLWARVTRTGQGMANPMDPSSTANPFSPAQDVNSAMTDTNPDLGAAPAGAGGPMGPANQPPDEIPGQTIPGSATGTAASSKPRSKPSENPNAPNKPQPMQPQGMPMMMPGQMMTGMPMMSSRAQVLIAESILEQNPGLSDDEALHLAARTIERYPHVVKEAYGGFDFPFEDKGDAAYSVCSQCGANTFDSRTGHCHNCGFVAGAGQVGYDPLTGPTTIKPGRFDMQNPGIS